MRNLKDNKTKIYPSTTRGGKELPSSSTLDSPSVLSKLATPIPAIDYDMSHVIHDATYAMHDAYDENTPLLDNTMPLGEFLDEQLARVRENEITETVDIIETKDYDSPPRMNCLRYLRVILWMKKLLETFLLVMIEMILRNY